MQEGDGLVEELKCSDGVRAILECPVCLEVGFLPVLRRYITKLCNPGYLLREFCVIVPSHWPA